MTFQKNTEFKNSWVVITGGDRGIGRAISYQFASYGANIIVIYKINKSEAKKTISTIKSMGVEARAIRCDVSNYQLVQKIFSQIIRYCGSIAVLINCAGIINDKTITNLTKKDWNIVIDTNLNGCFNCSKAVLKNMIKKNYGRIINISSVIAQTGNIGQSNYAASKSAIIGFTKSIALETAKYDITVNALSPGFIKTDMTKNIPLKIKQKIIKKIPKKRFGLPEEVARAAVFLASPQSVFITGQVLNINGGFYM